MIFPSNGKFILKKQAHKKIKLLNNRLQNFREENLDSAEDLAAILNEIRQAEQVITVLEYHVLNNEISSDLAMHLKVMENTDNDTHKPEPASAIQDSTQASLPEKTEIRQEADSVEIKPPLVSGAKSVGKIEFSINDRFRIINELFSQNTQEFSVALQQLNATENWQDAQHYLTGLIGLYHWDEERDTYKILYRAVQKRFS
mgnify:CR=1 FL=1